MVKSVNAYQDINGRLHKTHGEALKADAEIRAQGCWTDLLKSSSNSARGFGRSGLAYGYAGAFLQDRKLIEAFFRAVDEAALRD